MPFRAGALALEAAPRFWERYSQDRKRSVRLRPTGPGPTLWDDTGLHAAWLGHSTVLLKIEGVTILTDPVFSSRVGLNFGPVTLGLKRLVAPALARARNASAGHCPAVACAHGSLRFAESAGSGVVEDRRL